MNNYIFILWILHLFMGCNLYENQKPTKTIELNEFTEYYDYKNKQLGNIGRTIKIAYRDDCYMFIFLVHYNHTNDVFDEKSNTLTSTVIKVDTLYRYYTIGNQSDKGIVYGLHESPDGEIFLLDEMLKKNGLDSNNNKILSLNLGKPLQIVKQSKNKWTEIYTLPNKSKEDPDSIYRFFDSGFNDVKYSFSPSLDKEKRSKLVKTQFIYNPRIEWIDGIEIKVPRRVIEQEMKKGSHPEKLLNKYFQKFKKDSQTLL